MREICLKAQGLRGEIFNTGSLFAFFAPQVAKRKNIGLNLRNLIVIIALLKNLC